MIELYYFPTPNCHKITIFLEEARVDYRLVVTSIVKGEQFAPAFVDKFPNGKIPAIVDRTPRSGGAPLTVFESGAILLYLAERYEVLLPTSAEKRAETLQWLFWQVGGLGPMCGQNHHFQHYAPPTLDPGTLEYARTRFIDETSRLYAVLDGRLSDREFVAGEYSIADIACYPWINAHGKQSQSLADYPHLKRWCEQIAARPAVERAYQAAMKIDANPTVTDESRRFLYGQNAKTVRLHRRQ